MVQGQIRLRLSLLPSFHWKPWYKSRIRNHRFLSWVWLAFEWGKQITAAAEAKGVRKRNSSWLSEDSNGESRKAGNFLENWPSEMAQLGWESKCMTIGGCNCSRAWHIFGLQAEFRDLSYSIMTQAEYVWITIWTPLQVCSAMSALYVP